MTRPARGAYSVNNRIDKVSASKKATSLTMAELRTLIAVASCEVAHGGYPTKQAIWQTTGSGRSNIATQLVTMGLLHRVELTSEREAVYGLLPAGRRILGLGRAEAAE